MLYKKIHRQYLREFWKGRKFKLDNEDKVYEIVKEPYIGKSFIHWNVDENHCYCHCWYLISIMPGIVGCGSMWRKDRITWLED